MSTFPETRRVLRYYDDWPTKGVRFIDIAPALATPAAFKEILDDLQSRYSTFKIDRICGLEARGFFFAAPLALALGLPFVPIRKPNKLPGKVITSSYAKEYGTDSLCVQADAIPRGARVVIVDDILATGGTLSAAAELISKSGGVIVELVCVLEIGFLRGREKLPAGAPFHSLIVE
jgi:adenine phosphoribosyltransferase